MGPRSKGRKKPQAEQKKNYFKIQIKLIPTDEVFPLTQVHADMKISELKADLEFATGIPSHIQRVSYLDEGELLDGSDVRSNDVVPGAMLHMRVWSMWDSLVKAVAQNDVQQVLKMGVTNPTDFRSPNSDYMSKRAREDWLEERAAVALGMAANRGFQKLCATLIESGADVNASTEHGRSALHIASSQGHGHIVDLLLEKGADIDAEDNFGQTSLSIAERFGFKSCGRHLFLFHWQQRAKKVTPARNLPLMPHQKNDSLYPVWKRGKSAQLYLMDQTGPGEFEGSRLHAPKRGMHPSVRHKLERDRSFFSQEEETASRHESEEGDFFPDGRDSKLELPPIEGAKEPQSPRMRGGRLMKKPDTHQQWLQRLKAEEAQVMAEKRRIQEQEKQKQLMEEEKRKEENERLSYENWLAQRQQEKAERLSRTANSTARSGPDDPDHETDTDTNREAGALRLYLRSLGRTKTGELYENWLNDKEKEVKAMARRKPRGRKLPEIR